MGVRASVAGVGMSRERLAARDVLLFSSAAQGLVQNANQPPLLRRRRIGFSLTNVNTPGAVAVTCPVDEPSCPAFANGYLADSRITELTAAERDALFPSGTQARYKLVTGIVQAAQLYTVTLWGINDVTPGGVASDPSAEVATVGEWQGCGHGSCGCEAPRVQTQTALPCGKVASAATVRGVMRCGPTPYLPCRPAWRACKRPGCRRRHQPDCAVHQVSSSVLDIASGMQQPVACFSTGALAAEDHL